MTQARLKLLEMLRLIGGFRHLRVQACLVGLATGVLLYGIAAVTERINVGILAPSTPRSSLAINARNDGIIHSGPGEPVNGRLYRAGVGDR
jgi:hypothetical protein